MDLHSNDVNAGRRQNGFTIVELLIVIVVIAILATIAIVTYRSIQERARNTKRVSDASSVIKLIKMYKAQYGDWPYTGGLSCVGKSTEGNCYAVSSPTTNFEPLNTELQKVGTLPNVEQSPISVGSVNVRNMVYQYRPSNTLDGVAGVPLVMILYWLDGQNKNCNAGGQLVTGTGGTFSTTSASNSGNVGPSTLCQVALQ